MKTKIEQTVYQNVLHLLEENGITERQCSDACNLNPNFFPNIRKGITKHFRFCDVAELAAFFDVSIEYLCEYKNTRSEFFVPSYKLFTRDEKVMVKAFKKLDPIGRINTSAFMDEELKRSRERYKEKKRQEKLMRSEYKPYTIM